MHLCISSLHTLKSFDTSVIHLSSKHLSQSLPSLLGARSETSREATVRSNLVGNAGSRPISEAKQPWACPVLGWGTTGEAHVLYSTPISSYFYAAEWSEVRTSSVTLSSSHLVVFCPPLSPPSCSSIIFLHVLYSTHLIYSYAAQRSEVRTSAPTLDCFLPSSLSARPLVPRSSFSSRPDLCFSAGSGLPWRCGSIPPGLSS